jgi:tetratricopeptide (TPR) repeat protein
VIAGRERRDKLGTRSSWRNNGIFTLAFLAMLVLSSVSPAIDEASPKLAGVAALIQKGKLDEAEGRLWDVLKQHPENAEALNLLGSIRLRQKRLAEAETVLNRAIGLAPNQLPARLNLAQVFHAEGQTDKEIAQLLDAQHLAPADANVNCALAAAFLTQNDFHHALESLERIPPARRPDSALPLLAAGYLGLGRIEQARSLLPDLSARAAKNPALRVEFAEVLLDFDFPNDALALLEIARKQQAPTTELFFALGRARERKGELSLAEKDFQHSIDLNPDSVNAMQALARLLAGEGQWQKSAELLSRARKIAPDSPDILRKFTASSLHAGHAADAVEAAQQLLKLRPEETEALYLLGVAQLQDGESEEARATLETYIKLRPQDPLGFLALGMVQSGLREFPAAQSNFEQAIKLDPGQAEAHYQLALIFRDRGDNREAISQLEKGLAIDAQRAQAQALLGTLYLQQQDYGKAQEHLTRAVNLAPDSADTHYQLGLLFARLNQTDRAQHEMAEFRRLKDRDKEHSGPMPAGGRPATSSPPYPPS